VSRPAVVGAATFLRFMASHLRGGTLIVIDDRGTHRFGDGAPEVTMTVHDPSVYLSTLRQGSVGLGRDYADGLWDCDDLTTLTRILSRGLRPVTAVQDRVGQAIGIGTNWARRLRPPDKQADRQNIQSHYDVSNEFFALMLDETMMYSSAIFEHPGMSLGDAQRAKLDRLCTKLDLGPSDHLVEIGTGWGGLAVHAASHYGCRVTTTTISREQYELARERIARAGLDGQITVLLEDYRDLRGEYDALVSIEMIEAVGHQYLDTYFRQCSKLLKPTGAMLLQAITIRDQFYDEARRSVDFIKRFIFPGSFIPSVKTISESLARATDLKLFHMEDIGPHYATTLRAWRERFMSRLTEVRALGYPESFVRMWEYYLCYCEGGFEERQLGDVQMLLTKPKSRRATIATIHAAPALP
jgi:cyclopropane-fatty-acyl-phospholipid synthase